MYENKKYFDYLNNEIKEGMIIQHVKTKSAFTMMYGSSNPNKFVNIPENKWEVIFEYLITKNEKYSVLMADLLGCEITISKSLDHLFQEIDLTRHCIAIKGISDKKNSL